MFKKKKLVLVVAALLCCATLFSACGAKNATIATLYNAEWKETVDGLSSSYEKLDYKDSSFSSCPEGFSILEKEDGSIDVYNFISGKVVVSKACEENVTWELQKVDYSTYFEIFGHYFFVLDRTEKTEDEDGNVTSQKVSCYLMDENGKEIATADGIKDVNKSLDLILFDGVCYRVNPEDGSAEKAFEASGIAAQLPYLFSKVGDYYLSGYDVFDKDLNLLVSYTFPGHTTKNVFALLTDGKLLIQYSTASKNNKIKYDYESSGTYYNLHTMIMDVNTGKTKNLNVDYVFGEAGAACQLTENNYDELGLFQIDNYCTICPIVDKHMDSSPSAMKYYQISSSGKLGDDLLSGFFNGTVKELPLRLTTNRYLFTTMNDQQYLVNEKGETIGEVTGYTFDTTYQLFVLTDSSDSYFKCYDLDLKLVYDTTVANDEIYNYEGNTLFVESADGSIKVFDGKELKTLISAKDNFEDTVSKITYATTLTTINYNSIVVKKVVTDASGAEPVATTTYTLFAMNGTEIAQAEDPFSAYHTKADYDLIATSHFVVTTGSTVSSYYCVH